MPASQHQSPKSDIEISQAAKKRPIIDIAREKLDVNVWDYGYPFPPRWPRYPAYHTVTQYIEGSVIVDVVHAGTREVLWRGEGRAVLSDDPSDNVKQLVKAAEAIVATFPEASKRVVAVRP